MDADDYYFQIIHLEIDLVRFYHEIFLEEIQWTDWTKSILCVETVRRAYCKYTLENALTCVNFEDAGMRCAYIYLNTPCFSSAVAFHFWNLVHANPTILGDVRRRGTLNICCLGGGPAPEVVAIVKALEFISAMFCTPTKPLRICATVVDIDPGWAQTLEKVTQSWWKRINPAILQLEMSFVQADLTQQPLKEEVVEALRCSELVTMVKFVSAVYGTRGREKIAEMLKEITSHIADQGVLFFMNASRFSCMNYVNHSICSLYHMTPIYGPVYHDVYSLSEPSQRVCFRRYSEFYGLVPPQIQCKNHVAAWRKSANDNLDHGAPHRIMKDPDVELVNFFHEIIKDEIGLSSVATHKDSLKKVVSLCSHEEKGLPTSLTSPASRCAYIYHYSPCLTSALVSHFQRLLKNNTMLLRRIIFRKTISLCCLSTGLTTDFVAMVRALQNYCCTNNRLKQLKIDIVIINLESHWNPLMQKMADKIADASKWSLNLRFLPADLTEPLTDDVKEVLSQSDFITMTHFLSSIHRSGNSLQTIQEILLFMREGSTLFFLDSPGFHLCGALKDTIGSFENMKKIYGAMPYDIHRMSFLCMKECLKLYAKYYGWRYCSLESVNYVCAWHRATSSDSLVDITWTFA